MGRRGNDGKRVAKRKRRNTEGIGGSSTTLISATEALDRVFSRIYGEDYRKKVMTRVNFCEKCGHNRSVHSTSGCMLGTCECKVSVLDLRTGLDKEGKVPPAPERVKYTLGPDCKVERIKIDTTDALIELHKKLTDEAQALMKLKNRDYGDHTNRDPFANFRTWGLLGIMVRLDDKFSRLRTFVKTGTLSVKSEAYLDALLDIINYCVLLEAWMISEEKEK